MGRDFKIIIPGGCNAKCSFCFAGEAKPTSPTWIGGLVTALSDATEDFKELNITGGEPTASPYLIGALGVIKKYKHKFPKVVMTTNGYKLTPEILDGAVDHLNISRHHYFDRVNNAIFGTDTVPNADKLSTLITRCNRIGIDVSLSMTLLNNTVSTDVENMIQLAKEVGASALKVRRDYNLGLGESTVERAFCDIRAVHTSACEVCRVKTQLIEGLRVSWHAGVMEPSDIIRDDIHEIILQPTGKLTLDYAGNKPFRFPSSTHSGHSGFAKALETLRNSPTDVGGCGSVNSVVRGCGGNVYKKSAALMPTVVGTTSEWSGVSSCGSVGCGSNRRGVSGCGGYSSCGSSGC
jgi:pyruvate-formate lyase-activating enzyme